MVQEELAEPVVLGCEITPDHLKLPFAIAAKYAQVGTYQYDELVSAGYEGLVRGSHLYHPNKGASPLTYLYNWVEWKIKDAIRTTHKTYTTKDGAKKRCDKHEARWARLKSLDEPVGDKRNSTLADLLEAKVVDHWGAEGQEILDRVLSVLSPVDRDIYTMRCGESMKLKDIAVKYGVTREAIRLRLVRIRRQVKSIVECIGGLQSDTGSKRR